MDTKEKLKVKKTFWLVCIPLFWYALISKGAKIAWKWFWDDACEKNLNYIKWPVVIVCLCFSTCSGFATFDFSPAVIICVLISLNVGLTILIFLYEERQAKAKEEYVVRLEHFTPHKNWYKLAWLAASVPVCLFVILFRFGFEGERYYDFEKSEFVEPGTVNFAPYCRYLIVARDEGITLDGRYLNFLSRSGSASINGYVSLTGEVNSVEITTWIVQNAVREGRTHGHMKTQEAARLIATKFNARKVFDQADLPMLTHPDFHVVYTSMLKAFFAKERVTLEGEVDVWKIEIWPHYYKDDESE